MSSVRDVYTTAVQNGDIQADPEQQILLSPFEQIATLLQAQESWYRRLFPKPTIQGLYISGPVGGGKTYMMDLFYQYLPIKRKLRSHFSSFMQKIDQKLRLLQGHSDPIIQIAQEIAKQYTVICIDEFMVQDVAHAMILGELLQALFKLRVVLVATSNTKIDDLYSHGLNRERFLPAIALLHYYCDEINLQSSVDHRLGKLRYLHAYIYPLNAANQRIFTQQFATLAGTIMVDRTILIQTRQIPVMQLSQDAVWFDFSVICGMPRCQLDYIEIADRFQSIFVSNLPKLSDSERSTGVVLFTQLVDVLYDKQAVLFISAAVSIDELYTSGPFMGSFSRTISRLEEMQSQAYLQRYR